MFCRECANVSSPDDLGARVWELLELHEQRDHLAADMGWGEVQLPGQRDVWRQVARAAAQLELEEWELAAHYAAAACRLDANNAVVHYLTGLLRLEQASWAPVWDDAAGPSRTRFVSHPLPQVSPNS